MKKLSYWQRWLVLFAVGTIMFMINRTVLDTGYMLWHDAALAYVPMLFWYWWPEGAKKNVT